jgi:hypothetical protein
VAFDSACTTPGPRVAPPDHARPAETVLRTPFRVAFLPLRLMAIGVEVGVGHFGPRYLDPKPKQPPKAGIALAPKVLFASVSDLGIGPAIRWNGFPVADSRLDLSGTWSLIDRRHARLSETIHDRRPLGYRVTVTYDYKPDRRYYGIGNRTSRDRLSYFLLENIRTEAAILIGSSPQRQLRFVGGTSSMSPRSGYHGSPLLEDVFAPAEVPFEHRNTQELSYGVTGDLAALDDPRDPSRGVHGRVDVRRVAGMRGADPDYDQWRLEGRGYLPVFAKRRVLAARVVYSGVDPRDGITTLPFYRLALSDDDTRFAGFSAGRFRDRQLMLGRIEYRWQIIHRMSAVALYELGEVAPRAGLFRLGDTHVSYGGGLRLGLSDRSTLRAELANSVEGIHATIGLGGDF